MTFLISVTSWMDEHAELLFSQKVAHEAHVAKIA